MSHQEPSCPEEQEYCDNIDEQEQHQREMEEGQGEAEQAEAENR